MGSMLLETNSTVLDFAFENYFKMFFSKALLFLLPYYCNLFSLEY